MVNFIKKQVDREKYILDICLNKNVLNIGCLAANQEAYLHKEITKVSQSVLGLDIFDSGIKNYIKGDAQNFNFEDKFDVIVIGEVVEHLWNIEGMFNSAYNSLKDNGRLIITTPNAYAFIFLKSAILGKVVPNDPYHTLLFDITTLTNMVNNFAADLFNGKIFYYEEKGAASFTYKLQKILAKLNKNLSRGIVLDLYKKEFKV
jgi:2-polyprenyl-3-methyl-5-hydroxy-6-metoxy-1,4-benzoquinol methylase